MSPGEEEPENREISPFQSSYSAREIFLLVTGCMQRGAVMAAPGDCGLACASGSIPELLELVVYHCIPFSWYRLMVCLL